MMRGRAHRRAGCFARAAAGLAGARRASFRQDD
jgi:hypothetical protein